MWMSWLGRALAPLALCAVAAQAQPRPGFDCTKAGSAVDRLICSDEGLAKQDRDLSEQYERLHRTLTPEGFAVLRAGQRNWLASRRRCAAKDVTHDQGVQCLGSMYTDRANDLNAWYRTAAGLSIESRETTRRLPRLRVSESDSYPVLIGPRARIDAFNRYVAQRLNLAKGMFAASSMELDRKPEGDTTFSRYYEIHRFDDAVISIEIFQFHQSYFGHGWREEYTINWDLRRDRPLRIADLFSPDKDWQQTVYEAAMKYLDEQGEVSKPTSWFNSEQVDDDDAWLFDDDGAVLLFGHWERSMVGASADVPIPYDVLQPLLRPGTAVIPPETK